MRITDFAELIRCMPYREQAFEIKKKIWLPEEEVKNRFKVQNDRIDGIFKSMKHQQDILNPNTESDFNADYTIMISRNDLFYSTWNLEEFVIKVLMWGYPSKGQGNNIENILQSNNFNQTVKNLANIKQKGNISNEEVKSLFSDGLKLSTVSKFLYFLQINIDYEPALILDRRVINALTRKNGYEDEELKELRTLTYNNAPKNYSTYLRILNNLASQIQAKPDQVEMFLFEFGLNLKEMIGEESFIDK